jgi:divalent metal cation (Fe/Co/Zn/Cd) transporter
MRRDGRYRHRRIAETPLDLSTATRRLLLRRGLRLEYATLGWNVVGSVVVLAAAIVARSVALAGFGLDSLIEIVASAVVVWQLKGTAKARERKALRLIGSAFILLALYIAAQSIYLLAAGVHPHHSQLGIVWLALTALAMFALAYGKSRTGSALGNRVLQTEARITAIDGVLALAVLVGLALNATLAWWWADPTAAFVIVYYGAREGRAALTEATRGESR